jgi:hypothetical protein
MGCFLYFPDIYHARANKNPETHDFFCAAIGMLFESWFPAILFPAKLQTLDRIGEIDALTLVLKSLLFPVRVQGSVISRNNGA